MVIRLAAIVIATVSLAIPAQAQVHWNQFRGPHAGGVSFASDLPVKFGDGSPEIMWQTEVKGRAWSSPVVWKNQVWLTNAPEIQNPDNASNQNANPEEGRPPLEKPIRLSAVCVDLETGKVIHDITVFEELRPQFTHLTNSYASPTPWIEDGRLYVHFGAHGTACLDTTSGKKIWERTDIKCHHWRGAGSSPVIHNNSMFLCFDGYDKQFIIALDKRTGKTLWQRDREIDFGTDNGDRRKAYGTPQIVNVNGKDLLVSPFAVATIAYDVTNGDAVWTVYHGGMNAAARPLIGNGLVYICAGDGKNALVAVRPDGKGDVTKTHIAWRAGKLTPRRPSQLLVKDRYYMCDDDGVASCLNALTGELIWKGRIGGRHWASPAYADGHIYCLSQNGDVTVLKAGPKFEIVARNKLGEGFNASPAFTEDSMILRSMSHLYRIKKAG